MATSGRLPGLLLAVLVALSTAESLSGTANAPSVYWASNPNSYNDTVLIAGEGMQDAKVFICQGPTGAQQSGSCVPAPNATTWQRSVQLLLDSTTCKPGQCYVRVCASEGSPCSADAQINAPDVWSVGGDRGNASTAASSSAAAAFVRTTSGAHLGFIQPTFPMRAQPSSASAGFVRIIGRGLGFDSSDTCIAGDKPMVPSNTKLLCQGLSPVAATSGTCYDALFPALPKQGTLSCVVQTQWGTSAPFNVTSLPPLTPNVVTYDVDKDYGGNITAALSSVVQRPNTVNNVLLAARVYDEVNSLDVPNNTFLVGAGMSSSQLMFQLPTNASFAVRGYTNWGLRNLTINIIKGLWRSPAVLAPPGSSHMTFYSVNVTMNQLNVSNAFQIQGTIFAIGWCAMHQQGVCLYPPHSEDSNFMASTTLYMHKATWGWIHDNTVRWKCSWMDADVSSNIVLEHNDIRSTEKGILPHGNSISNYDFHGSPDNINWLYARNYQARPPYNDPHNWAFHEALTTDGSGGWGAGNVTAVSGSTVSLSFNITSPAIGARALIANGPGAGQWRLVTGQPSAASIQLDTAFDNFVNASSVIAVVSRAGDKIVAGNTFSWSMVVQWFGQTVGGVIADNTFVNDNVRSCGYNCTSGDAAMEAFGLCYSKQLEPLFFCEYSGNTMINSSGITIHDRSPASNCPDLPGPYARWQVLRRNSIGGIALSSPGVCGTINATNTMSTDIVVEHNSFQCDTSSAILPGGGVNVAGAHCLVR